MITRALLLLSLALLVEWGSNQQKALAELPASFKGKLVYFGRAEESSDGALSILVQARSGATEKVASIESEAHSGRVSPTGDQIAFWGESGGRHGIWLISANGAKRSWLVEAQEDTWIGGWSPNGERLVFGHGDSSHQTNLLIDVKTKTVQSIRLPASEAIWDWSPDGTDWLTISSQETGRQIQRVRTDGSGLTCLTTPGTDNISPRFSPDGKQILFSSSRTKRAQLYAMDWDGGHVRQLTKFDDRSCSNGCWTPDGKEICCRAYKTGPVTESGYSVSDPEVLLMNADGTEPKVFLPGNESVGWTLDWR